MSRTQVSLGIHLSEKCICISVIRDENNLSSIIKNNPTTSCAYKPVISFSKTSPEIRFGIEDEGISGVITDITNNTNSNYKLTNHDGYLAYNLAYNNRNICITPKDICSLFIKHICSKALEDCIATDATSANDNVNIILALPSTFSLIQKDLVIQSVKMAGYCNVNVITDSAASALFYMNNSKSSIERNSKSHILTIHFKNTSYYISLLEIDNTKISLIDRIGEKNVGLNQIIDTLFNYIVSNNILALNNDNISKLIHKQCEEAIEQLVANEKYTITINNHKKEIDRNTLSLLCNDQISHIVGALKNIIKKNEIQGINCTILTEESSKIPNLDIIINNIFETTTIYKTEDIYGIFSKGSALYSYYSKNSKFPYRIYDSNVSKSITLVIDVGEDYYFGYYYNHEEEKEKIISKNKSDLFPAIVYFNKEEDERIIGVKPSLINLENYTVVNRMADYIGKKKTNINDDEKRNVNYEIIKDIDNLCMYKVYYNSFEKYYYPTQIVSSFLEYMKGLAITQIDRKYINGNEYLPVILPIPIEFNFIQRNEIYRAASEAGLKVQSMIPEPVCSLIASIAEKEIKHENCNVLVFHMCNTSCKATILTKEGNNISVVSTLSDKTVGRMSIVNKMDIFIINEMIKQLKLDKLPDDIQKIKDIVKKKLMNNPVKIEYGNRFTKEITIDEIEELCKEELKKIKEIVRNVVRMNRMNIIKYIILVGRGSRYPVVIDSLKGVIKDAAICKSINEYEIIIKGGLEFAKCLRDNSLNEMKYNVRGFLPRSINMTVKQEIVPTLSYGIDLGTTYSSAAYIKDDGNAEFFDSNTGSGSNHFLPSCVSYNNESENVLVGEPALQIPKNKKATLVYDSKRFIGKRYVDIAQNDIDSFPFELVSDNGKPAYKVTYNKEEKVICPYAVSSEILRAINKSFVDRISHIPHEPKTIQLVIGVPAVFTDSQREDTFRAANEVGFRNIILIPEPSAAALAYIYSNDKINEDSNAYFLVYDFGGGTFDVSIVHLENKYINIVATDGDDNLGGQDITRRLENYVINMIKADTKYKDIEINERIKKRIHNSCENVKRNLSCSYECDLSFELKDEIDFTTKMLRATLDELCRDLYEKTIEITLRVLEKAKLEKNKIKYVIMSGGSSRIPRVKKLLQNEFESDICDDVNSDEVVAKGCAIYAKSLNDDKFDKYRIEEKPFTSYSDETILANYNNLKLFYKCESLPCGDCKYENIDEGRISVEISEDDGFGKMNYVGSVSFDVSKKEDDGEAKMKMSFNISEDGIMKVKLERKNENKNAEKEFVI